VLALRVAGEGEPSNCFIAATGGAAPAGVEPRPPAVAAGMALFALPAVAPGDALILGGAPGSPDGGTGYGPPTASGRSRPRRAAGKQARRGEPPTQPVHTKSQDRSRPAPAEGQHSNKVGRRSDNRPKGVAAVGLTDGAQWLVGLAGPPRKEAPEQGGGQASAARKRGRAGDGAASSVGGEGDAAA
jgi:hypothetical protein